MKKIFALSLALLLLLVGTLGVTKIEVKAQEPEHVDFNLDTHLLAVMPNSPYSSPADLNGKKIRLLSLETHKGGAQ